MAKILSKKGGGVSPKSVIFFGENFVRKGGGTPFLDKIRKVVFDALPNRVLLKRENEENKYSYKKLSENKGIVETERVIYSEDGRTKKGVVKEQFAKVTKSKSSDAENIDPDNRKKRANNQRRQSENVQNVLEHVAGDDIANKASILASKSTRRALILLPQF